MHVQRRPEILAASLLFFGPLASLAQSPVDGAIHGLAHNARGIPIAGASIAVRALDAPDLRTASAQPDGTFLLPHLTPGTYTLTISAPSAPPQPPSLIEVTLGETVEVDLTLANPATASTSRTPLSAPDQPLPDQDEDGLLSLHGLPSTANTTLLDGADTTQAYTSVPAGAGSDPAPDPDGDPDSADRTSGPSKGLARGRHAGVAYIFSQSAVREFRVAGQLYSAQYGHAAGSVITTVSRSGTEHLHASAFYVVRSQLFAAANPLSFATAYSNGAATTSVVKPHDLRQIYGGAFGGPLPLRNTFFFYSLDQQRRNFPAVSSPADPGFYYLTPTQRALLGNRGVTSTALNTALTYLSSLSGPTPRSADQTLNFGRIDWRPRPHLTLAAEYNRVRWNSPAGLIDAPVVARGRASIGNAAGSLDAVIVRATTSLNPHILNQATIAFLHDLQYETPQTPLPQESAISPGGLAPEVNIAPNGFLFGTPASLSQLAYPDERRIQLADTLTLTRGHHLIQLGGDVSFVHDRVATQTNAAGTFRYDSGITNGCAGGLVDFITDFTFNAAVLPNGGCPSIFATPHLFCFRSFSQTFGQSLRRLQHSGVGRLPRRHLASPPLPHPARRGTLRIHLPPAPPDSQPHP